MSEYIIGNDGDESILDIGEFELRFQERERIVRCRDCAWSEAREYRRHCDRTGSFQIEPDGFCAWGERK